MDPSISHEPTQFWCDVCQQGFSTKGNLEAHFKSQKHLVKTGVDSTDMVLGCVCVECGASFSRQSSLHRHKKSVHKQTPEHFLVCKHCPKTFSNQATLSRHLHSHLQIVLSTSTAINELNVPSVSSFETVIDPSSPAPQSNVCHAPSFLKDSNHRSPSPSQNIASGEFATANTTSNTSGVTQSSHTLCFSPAFQPSAVEDFPAEPSPILDTTVTPGIARHCVTLLFPALADDTHKFAKGDDKCSLLERHCFALVLLACCLSEGLGHCGRLRIVVCDGLTDALLFECATLLHLMPLWSALIPKIVRFRDFASLVNGLNVSNFVPAPLTKHSLFVVSHADYKRLRVNFGRTQKMLCTSRVVDLIHACNPQHVHLMCCKSSKLAESLRKDCRRRGICHPIIWCAYGNEDVTTVPFDFGCALHPDTDWFKMPLERDLVDTAHSHITASVQSFLCSLSKGNGHTIEDVVRSVRVPIHSNKRLELYPGEIRPPNSIMGHVDHFYPFTAGLEAMLANVGISWAKYNWYLRKLEGTSSEELLYC